MVLACFLRHERSVRCWSSCIAVVVIQLSVAVAYRFAVVDSYRVDWIDAHLVMFRRSRRRRRQCIATWRREY